MKPLAAVLIDGYLKSRSSAAAGITRSEIVPQGGNDAEERAAIMEYEGNMSRAEADQASGLVASFHRRASARIR